MSWSIERAVVGFLSGAAVFVQGVIDAVSPPNFQPVGDSHPIPGCPRPVECRTHGCAGDCSEALEYGPEEWCITSPFMETPMPTTFHNKGDAEALVHRLQGDLDGSFRRLTVEPVPPNTSRAVSADSSRDSAAEGGLAPLSPSVACQDPSPNGDEGPAPVGHSPGRGAGHPDDAAAEWIGEAVPTISEVLLEHYFYLVNASSIGPADHCLCGNRPHGVVEWNRHVASLIAEALAPQPK